MDNNSIIQDKLPSPRGARGVRKGEPRLNTLNDIRRELVKIYKATFYRGEILPEDYSRAVYGLRTLAEVIDAADIEERLQRLEERK